MRINVRTFAHQLACRQSQAYLKFCNASGQNRFASINSKKRQYDTKVNSASRGYQQNWLQRSNIYLLMRQEKFPKSVSMGGRAVAWLESEVDTWIQERVDLRDHNEITNIQNSVQG